MLSRMQEKGMSIEDLTHEEMEMFNRFLTKQAHRVVSEQRALWEISEGVVSFDIEVCDAGVDEMSKVVEEKGQVTRDLRGLWERETYDLSDEIDIDELKNSRKGLHRRVKSLPRLSIISNMDQARKLGTCLNILNIVTAGSYAYRRYNGDFASNSCEVASLMYELAPTLKNDWKTWYCSVSEAFRMDLLKKEIGVKQRGLVRGIVQDTATILSNRFYVCELLFLLYDCYLREMETSRNKSFTQLSNSTLQKIIYFMTFTRENGSMFEKSIRDQVKEQELRLEGAEEMLKETLNK